MSRAGSEVGTEQDAGTSQCRHVACCCPLTVSRPADEEGPGQPLLGQVRGHPCGERVGASLEQRHALKRCTEQGQGEKAHGRPLGVSDIHRARGTQTIREARREGHQALVELTCQGQVVGVVVALVRITGMPPLAPGTQEDGLRLEDPESVGTVPLCGASRTMGDHHQREGLDMRWERNEGRFEPWYLQLDQGSGAGRPGEHEPCQPEEESHAMTEPVITANRSLGRARELVHRWFSDSTTHTWHDRSQVLVIIALAIAVAFPLWAVERPPLQDLPEHVAAIRVISDFGDPALRFRDYFELQLWRTQYVSVYLLGYLLCGLVSPLVAAKLILTLGLVATPLGLRRLLRQLGADPNAALLSLPLLFNVHVLLGFINFVLAIPMLFFGLAAALGLRESQGRTGWLAVTGWAGLCFVTHVLPFALLMCGLVVILLPLLVRKWRWAACTLGPVMVLSLFWFFSTPSGDAVRQLLVGQGQVGASAVISPPEEAIREWVDWLGTITRDPEAAQRTVVAALLLLVALVHAGLERGQSVGGSRDVRAAGRHALGVIFVLCVLGYFCLPTSYSFMWPISRRFVVLGLLSAIPAAAAAPPLTRHLAILGSVLLALIGAGKNEEAFRRFEARSYRGLDPLIARIPEGHRVAGLVFNPGDPDVKFSPLLHAVNWVQAARGGAVMFTFAEFPQSPFAWNPEQRPPQVPPRWEWLPERVRPDRDLVWYDYVLVHQGPGRIADSCRFVLDQRDHGWSLYRRVGSRVGCDSAD